MNLSYISFPGIVVRANLSFFMVLGIEPRTLHVLDKCLPTELHSSLPAFFVFVFETGTQHVVRTGLELTEAHLALPSECQD